LEYKTKKVMQIASKFAYELACLFLLLYQRLLDFQFRFSTPIRIGFSKMTIVIVTLRIGMRIYLLKDLPILTKKD
jgi:hypothetical protein